MLLDVPALAISSSDVRARFAAGRPVRYLIPREVEEFLHGHPKVEDVQVVGIADEKLGEELCACIKLREGETADAEEIRAYCRERLAHFKVPRYVDFVEEFPLTVTGKVQKFKLRELAEVRIGVPVARR